MSHGIVKITQMRAEQNTATSLRERGIDQFKARYLPIVAQFSRTDPAYAEKIYIIQKAVAKDFTHGPPQLLWIGGQMGHMPQVFGDAATLPRQERPEYKANS